MRVKQARGRIAPKEGEGVGGELPTKLGSNYVIRGSAGCLLLLW